MFGRGTMRHHYERALITGGTSGIGEAFARQLPPQTQLLLTGRDAEKLARLEAQLTRPRRRVETVSADLTLEADRAKLAAAAAAFAPDLLINNAGAGRLGRFLDNDPESEIATVMVNVVAVVTLTRALLPGMIARAAANGRRAGLIIVASAAAFAPVPLLATYTASKTFDLHFTEALAEELRNEPIDVMALCPGPTRTAFGSRAGYDLGNLPGAADPADVAKGAMAALGRETVHVSGFFSQTALAPVVRPRRLITGAIGWAMRWAASRQH
jgi:short-subunit dehydrogenase